jgi:hypothetical protein
VTGYVVVLDANVLYGIEVTDFFATMATRRLFRVHWSPQILEEVERNLLERFDLDPVAVHRRLALLNQALPGAMASVPAPLIEAMPVNEKDRHVLALAVHVAAGSVVTENLRDFPASLVEPFGIEAISADAFALAQVGLHADQVMEAVMAMSARRRRAPRTPEEIMEGLARRLPRAMEALRTHVGGGAR